MAIPYHLMPPISDSHNMPYRLDDICVKFLAKYINVSLLTRHMYTDCIFGETYLPAELSERLLETIQKFNVIADDYAELFGDLKKFRLNHIKIWHGTIDNKGLKALLSHYPTSFHIFAMPNTATHDLLDLINQYGKRMESLVIGSKCPVFMNAIDHFRLAFVLSLSKLKYLSIHKQQIFFPMLLMRELTSMTHLNLSECSFFDGLVFDKQLEQLESLILHDVNLTRKTFLSIPFMRKLQHLDVSSSSETPKEYVRPNHLLSILVKNLPNLQSLDISGTNLAGNGVAMSNGNGQSCDIPGLVSRVNNPLEFLGLYGTAHLACCRHDIPAKEIAGQANEEQIYIAATAYKHRPEILTRVMNDLYHWFRYESDRITQIDRALAVVLDAMDTHCHQKHIQISGSATIFYIVKGKEKSFTPKLRRHIINSLLNGMQAHIEDDTMMRNGCLTLCQFLIPADFMFEFKRIVIVLLYGATYVRQLPFVQRIAIFILNSLACQVDGSQKQFLGEIGTISKLLMLITDRVNRLDCDDVLELAWSTMWNITDETPSNCSKFINGNGINVFLDCLTSFQSYFQNSEENRAELLRNMMGLLGNVAEVSSLRYAFMKTEFLTICSELLDSYSDGIEVSYNAAGVIAHLMSDGAEAWTVSEPSREHVQERMLTAIERWDLNSTRNINYRSFEPILGLLKVFHTPACQHWAVWALANLTTVYPAKYCSLVQHGRDLLQSLIDYPFTKQKTRLLAYKILENCRKYESNPENNAT